ncbi:imelysin family protein [Teredinibacter turnerae]|uniref:imelysin family protein n=1 Tax=Teredinibacter turnerae TaxID=2426 RepID=UPI00036BA953|nr:imelysin family protein [Teredinibacter turnerae]
MLSFRKLAISSAVVLLAACGGGGSSSSDSGSSTSSSSSSSSSSSGGEFSLENARKVLNTNADIAFATYSDSVDTAKALQTAIATFKAEPTQANLDAAKIAWLVSREPYGQTEVYRFRLSPIDSTDYQNEDGPEGDINAWPLGEALIDYTVSGSDFGADQTEVSSSYPSIGYPQENIINSDVAIDDALFAAVADVGDERGVISGYHAIEFMLWGQDLNTDGSADTEDDREMSTGGNILNSGGHRPLSDFTTDANAARRMQFMEVVAAKLVADLEAVRDGWAAGSSYRTAFTTVNTETQAVNRMAEILFGMGTLSTAELAGERMQIAFSSGSQEDEHSCFSDNTHRDIWLDAEGVSNSYYGVYAGYDSDLDGTDDVTTRAVNGYGIDDYLNASGNSALDDKVSTALSVTATNYEAIDASARAGTPFDNLIMDEARTSDNPVAKTILSLTEQTLRFAEIAVAIGYDGSVVDDGATDCDTTQPDQTCD